jgi:hypothetical protein
VQNKKDGQNWTSHLDRMTDEKEYRNRLYSANQKAAEIEEGIGTERMSMRGRNRLDFLYHEAKRTSFNM